MEEAARISEALDRLQRVAAEHEPGRCARRPSSCDTNRVTVSALLKTLSRAEADEQAELLFAILADRRMRTAPYRIGARACASGVDTNEVVGLRRLASVVRP